MVKLLHEIWSKSSLNKLCQVFWMVFWWYSAQKIFRFSPPRRRWPCARIRAGRRDSCLARSGYQRGSKKISWESEFGRGRSLSPAPIVVRRGRTAGVVVETPTTLLMPHRSSLPHGCNRGMPRFTSLELLHRRAPRLSHDDLLSRRPPARHSKFTSHYPRAL
jgi:hypothetical protein